MSAALMVGGYGGNRSIEPAPGMEQAVSATGKITCKTGFKAGKTPVSLVVGAKPGCYKVVSATAGKKLLTTDKTKTCMGCHSSLGIAPASLMNSNLRTQGYTLKPASIQAAFDAHSAEMLGSIITPKDAQAISAYLQSLK